MTPLAITKKQNEIISWVVKFRFLSTSQVQQLLGHKSPRTSQIWLRDLTEKDYLARRYSRTTFFRANSPAVYSLAVGSVAVLGEKRNEDLARLKERLYNERKRSARFIKHCLGIADIFLYLRDNKKVWEKVSPFTRWELEKFDYLPDPRPDLYLVVYGTANTRRYFLVAIDDYTPSFIARRQIKQYLEYAQEEGWAKATGDKTLPAVLVVLPNERVKRHIFFYTKALLEEVGEKGLGFFLTTKERLMQTPETEGDLWQKVGV